MNAQDNDVCDAAVLKQVEDLPATVADAVVGANLERGDLAAPGAALTALRRVVASAVRIVDRERTLLAGVE